MQINTKKIQFEMDRNGWTKVDLANRMGVSRQWVDLVMQARGSHTFKTVVKFAAILGVDPRDLIT